MIVCGIDPGGAHTGVVVRDGSRLHEWTVIDRDGLGLDSWCHRVLDRLQTLTTNLRLDLVAVEGLNPPTPQMGTTSVTGLIDTAAVLGAVIGWCDGVDLIVVPPGGHGSAADGLGRAGLLAAYPPELVGPRETSGTGRARHARSAWDVAAAGARTYRLEVA